MAGSSHTKADFNVYLDGTRLDGATKAAISGVRVYLTHSGASAFEIVVDDPELRWQAKPTFTECKEVQIELGLPGKMKKVFDGEVTAWRTELERSGPTVLVLRGLDRSHRLMRGHKTKTYAEASPIDCAQQIASAAGLSAKTSAGQPAPVKTFRIQANESDFNFLRKIADLEGYLFYVDGSELHFERPKLSSNDDVTVTFGEDLKTFLPVANFRRPAAKVEVGAWDSAGKAALTGKAKPGDELWSVPGGKPGADVAKFQGTKASVGIVESQVATQEHADTVAKAALTKRSLEFLTAEVEVQGNPDIKPGAMVNVKKVGVYSGHYLVTEANHFFDAAGYNCIFYVARDKWGDSSTDAEKKRTGEEEKKRGKGRGEQPYKPPKPPEKPKADEAIDFTLEGDDGKPLANVPCKIKLKSGEVIEATTDGDGHVYIDKKPEGPYTVEISGDALELASIDVAVEDAQGAPLAGASGKVKLSDGMEIAVTTDAEGTVHLEDVPKGEYTFTLDAPAPAAGGATDGGSAPGGGAAGGGAAPDQGAPAGGAGGEGATASPGGGSAGDAAPGQGAPAGGAGGEGATAAPSGGSAGDVAPSPGAPPGGAGAKGGGTAPRAAAAGGAAPGGATARAGGKETAPGARRGRATAGEVASPRPADAGAGGKTGSGSPAGAAPPPARTGSADAKSAAGSGTSAGAGSAAAATPVAGTTPAGAGSAKPPAAASGTAGAAPTAGAGPRAAAPAPAPTRSGAAPGSTGAASPSPAPTASGAPVAAGAATIGGPGAPSGAATPATPAPAGSPAPAAPAGPTEPDSSGGTPARQTEGPSPIEIGGIGASVATVAAVSASVATGAEGVEAVKGAAKSAADRAKVPDSENVEE